MFTSSLFSPLIYAKAIKLVITITHFPIKLNCISSLAFMTRKGADTVAMCKVLSCSYFVQCGCGVMCRPGISKANNFTIAAMSNTSVSFPNHFRLLLMG